MEKLLLNGFTKMVTPLQGFSVSFRDRSVYGRMCLHLKISKKYVGISMQVCQSAPAFFKSCQRLSVC